MKFFRKESIEIEVIELNMSKLTKEVANYEERKKSEQNEISEPSDIPEKKSEKNLMKGFCLSIAYSASIGGSGCLVGSQPNLILKGYFDENYPDAGLNFLTYMAYFLPNAFFMVFFSWLVVYFLWLPKRYII